MASEREEDAYLGEIGGAEARASVEPVVVAKFVDLDAPFVGRLMRHLVGHHRRLGVPSFCGNALVVCEEVGRNVEVLLQREFGVGGVAKEGKRRHFGTRGARDDTMRARVRTEGGGGGDKVKDDRRQAIGVDGGR